MISFDKYDYQLKLEKYNHKISSCWDSNETDDENFYRGFRNMPNPFLTKKIIKKETIPLFLERINKIKELISENCKIISFDFFNIIIYNEESNFAILLNEFLSDFIRISLISKTETILNEITFPFKEDKTFPFKEDKTLPFNNLLLIFEDYINICDLNISSDYILK